jgi:hypothetical protein
MNLEPAIARRGVLASALGLAAAAVAETGEAGDAMTIPPATEELAPFRIEIPQSALNDLKRRLAAVRWPDAGPVSDWGQGVPLPVAQALIAYWRDRYLRRGPTPIRSCAPALTTWGSTSSTCDPPALTPCPSS